MARTRTSPAGEGPAAAGFTLLELLVVLAVIGVILAAIPGFMLRGSPSTDVEAAARVIADDLRRARSRAVLENRDQVVTVDVENNRIRPADGAPLRQVDRAISLGLTSAVAELAARNIGNIRFHPDGSSTGGQIRLQQDGFAAEITIDWLTGDVGIERTAAAPTP